MRVLYAIDTKNNESPYCLVYQRNFNIGDSTSHFNRFVVVAERKPVVKEIEETSEIMRGDNLIVPFKSITNLVTVDEKITGERTGIDIIEDLLEAEVKHRFYNLTKPKAQ